MNAVKNESECDVCGYSCHPVDLQRLLSCYQQPGLVEICPRCSSWANAELDKIRSANSAEMKRRIELRALELNSPAVKSRAMIKAAKVLLIGAVVASIIIAIGFL